MHITRNLLSQKELDEIAARINRRHRRDVKDMLETGADLKRVRHGGVVNPGGWMVWFAKHHFPFSLSSAENYMRSDDWVLTLSDVDRFVVATIFSVELVISLSRKGVPDQVKKSMLELAKQALRDRKDKRKAEEDKAQFSPEIVKAAVARVRADQREEEARRKAELNPIPPIPENFVTDEDCLRLCKRLYDGLQPDAVSDATMLADLSRTVWPGQQFIFKIFEQVAQFIDLENLAWLRGSVRKSLYRPPWAKVQHNFHPDQGDFNFPEPAPKPRPSPPNYSPDDLPPKHPTPEWAE